MVPQTVSATPDEARRAAFRVSDRGELALVAAWEIDAIAAVLQRRFCAADCPSEDLALRGLSIRLETLGSVVMTCLDDEHANLEGVRKAIEGPERTRVRAQDSQGG